MKTEEEQEIYDYIKNNLRLSVQEEAYGFNGKHIVFKLILDDEVLSEDYIDIKQDEG